MKKLNILILVAGIMISTACKNNEITDEILPVDLQKYDSQLYQDYSNALFYHNALLISKALVENSYTNKGRTSDKISGDSIYNRMMFNVNDSLFSEHFYEFCIDMMENSGMMGNTDNMSGNNSSMMGSGGMMNGSSMGSLQDMNEMMAYMDSVFTSGQTMTHPDFMRIDSLIHNQMILCNMMIDETNAIEQNYENMQLLRKNHNLLHGN